MNKSKLKFPLILFSLDLMLLNISFFVLNYLKRGFLSLPDDYVKLLLGFNAIFVIVSLFTKKFNVGSYASYSISLRTLFKSIILIVYSVSFFIVLASLSKYSRLQVFGTCLLWFILEIIIISIYHGGFSNNFLKKFKKVNVKSFLDSSIYSFILFTDFLILIISFFILNFYKRSTLTLPLEYEKILLIIIGIWFFVSLITRKFDTDNFQNYFYAMAACIKSIIMMGFIVSVAIYALRLSHFSRLHIYGSLLLSIFIESVLYYFYFKLELIKRLKRNIRYVRESNGYLDQHELPVNKNNKNAEATSSFMKILSDIFLLSYPGLFDFVAKSLDVKDINPSEITILNSPDRIHLKSLEKNSFTLLINFHKVNDIRWINQYFLEVHKLLQNGGFYVGRAFTINIHKKNFFKKFPKYYSNILYLIHFLFFRMFPKLPILKKVYFSITKGRARVISRAELLGRLYYCGFEVIAEEEINGNLFFIAQKARTPSSDPSPTYGPFVMLERIGMNGQIIKVYKLRTMYPYSEYLQDYIYNRNKLEIGGKIKEDFRVTEYGKFLRKYWLDELPMLINWLRGELKLFGVRPLSKQYLGLYDQNLREIRKSMKPGLIPPYYADLPKEIAEIRESERKYIQAFCKNPLRTQWNYLWKTLNNIVFKGARSS